MAKFPFLQDRQRMTMALVAIPLLVVVVLWMGMGLKGKSSRDTTIHGEPVARVVRGPLTISFTERGSVKASSSKQIVCRLEGSSTIVSVVDEGTFVKEGDLLVELDSSQLTEYYNKQMIDVEIAEASLAQAKEAVLIQESQNGSDLQAASLAVELAEIDVQKFEKGDWELALAKAESEIFLAQEELQRAKNTYEWTKKLAEKGYVTRTELIGDDISVKRWQVSLDQAKGGLRVLKEYTYLRDSKLYASNLDQSEQALERTRLENSSQMTQVTAEEKAKNSTYSLSKERLEKIEDQLEKTKIFAPQDGMVVYFYQPGRYSSNQIIEQGATVRQNQSLINLPDLSRMSVSLQIQEARIHQVRTGLPTTVTIEAQSEHVLRGTISQVSLLPDSVSRYMNPDLRAYKAEVAIDPNEEISFLRPGMSAKVEILVDQLADVLYVPVQSVTTIDGEPVCLVWNENEFAKTKVKVGLSNDSFIVIEGGLEEDNIVMLNAPPPMGVPPKSQKEPGGVDEYADPGTGNYPSSPTLGSRREKGKGTRGEGGRRGPDGSRGGGEMGKQPSGDPSGNFPDRRPMQGGKPGRKAS